MNSYLSLIKEALEDVPEEYYQIKTAGSENYTIRERVFCYEFYHRIRNIQERNNDYTLCIHGEIDKRGHQLFKDSSPNPDFIFHIPGNMESNYMVIEVKCKLDKCGIKKDFKTISDFIKKVSYKYGVFILINYCFEELKRFVKSFINEEKDEYSKCIIILCKKSYEKEIEEHYLYELYD